VSAPFEPIGEVARWQTIYKRLRAGQVGEVIEYSELEEMFPDATRAVIQGSMRRAAREFEITDKHAVEAVKNRGYRIVQPVEHMRLAKNYQRRSSRSLVRAANKVTHVDLSALTPEVKATFALMATALSQQQETMRRLNIGQKRLQEQVDSIKEQSKLTDDEVAVLRERLDKLENRLTGE